MSRTSPAPAASSIDASGKALHTGWLAGIGAEYAFLGNWSAKLEYNYINFGPQDVTTSGVRDDQPFRRWSAASRVSRPYADIRQDMHLVKFGINYHFNSVPAVISARF